MHRAFPPRFLICAEIQRTCEVVSYRKPSIEYSASLTIALEAGEQSAGQHRVDHKTKGVMTLRTEILVHSKTALGLFRSLIPAGLCLEKPCVIQQNTTDDLQTVVCRLSHMSAHMLWFSVLL